jgi:hypothetical protein
MADNMRHNTDKEAEIPIREKKVDETIIILSFMNQLFDHIEEKSLVCDNGFFSMLENAYNANENYLKEWLLDNHNVNLYAFKDWSYQSDDMILKLKN